MNNPVSEDFDLISLLPDERWNHSIHHYGYLLRRLPERPRCVIDVGCGCGRLARLMARRAEQVVGVDFSQGQIENAVSQSRNFANIRFVCDDAMAVPYADYRPDAIVTVDAMHHFDIPRFLKIVGQMLEEGGVFLCLDLYSRGSFIDYLLDIPSVLLNPLFMLIKNGRLSRSRLERQAWAEHLKHDRLLTLRQIEALVSQMLPGAVVRRHLFWRYSVYWKKPAGR